MIITNSEYYGNSFKDVKFFKEHYQEITPIKKLTIYFDSENFILSDYSVDKGTTFVAEGWNGNQIHLTGLNCGYGGTAPNKTLEVLSMLKINKTSIPITTSPGIQIEFDKNEQIINFTNNAFFSSQSEYQSCCQVFLNSYTNIDMENKKIYFINPQYYNPNSVYNLISKLHPYEFQYYIGSASPLDNHFTPELGFTYSSDFKKLTGVNLILKCKKMDILFLVDKDISRSFINTMYYSFKKRPLFADDDFVYAGKSKYKLSLISLLNKRNKSEQQGIVTL